MSEKPWFKHKRYGAGFGVGSWQGWIVTIAYLIGATFGVKKILDWRGETSTGLLMGLAFVAAVTCVYLAIVWKTRDRTRRVKWRWGADK